MIDTLLAGTVGGFLAFLAPECVKVPEDTYCLSECAFGALKANRIEGKERLGFHRPYDPKTMEPTLSSDLQTLVFLSQYGGGYVSFSDLYETTPSVFWIDGELINWRDLPKRYKISSSVDALEACDGNTE